MYTSVALYSHCCSLMVGAGTAVWSVVCWHLQYPDGWLESQKAKEQEEEEGKSKGKSSKGKGKRKRLESDSGERLHSFPGGQS